MKKILFFILILGNSIFAQQQPEKTSLLSINFPDRSVKFEVLNIKKNIRTNENLTYYWCAFNKILETKGGYGGKVLHGNYTAFYLSENLEEKGRFDYGLKNGKWTVWYENGQIKEIISWSNGMLNGQCKYFDNKGIILSEVNYRRGVLHGYKIIYSDNKVVETKKYKNGLELKIKEKKAESPKPEKLKKETKKNIFNTKEEKKLKKKLPENTSPKNDLKKRKSIFEKKDKDEKKVEQPKSGK